MDVRLPNGKIVSNIPEGISKAELQDKLIRNGLATPEDFATAPTEQISASETILPMIGRGMVNLGRSAENILDLENRPLTGSFPQGEEEAALVRPMIEQNPKTSFISETIGEYAPTALAGSGVGSAIQKGAAIISKKAAPYLGAMAAGGTEGALIGGINDQAGTGAAIGAAGGAVFQKVMPIIANKLSGLFGNKAPIMDMVTVDPSGNVVATQQGKQLAQSQGLDLDSVIREATSEASIPEVPTAQAVTNIAESAIKKPQQATEELAGNIGINKRRVLAAEEEGINLTPGALSDDPSFIEYQAAISSEPRSQIKTQQQENLMDIAKSVDNLREEMTKGRGDVGTLDVGAIDQRVVNKFNQTTSKIKAKEERVYDSIEQGMAGKSGYVPNSLISMIEDQASKVGGMAELQVTNPSLVKIYNDLTGLAAKNRGVTYSFIDSLRKQVGSGYKMKGDFQKASDAELDMLYGALAQDQKAMIEAVDPLLAKKYAAINKATQIRKGMENDVKSFTPIIDEEGKVLISAKYVSRIGNAMRDATGGNPQQFNKLIALVPKQNRAEVVATALESLISAKRIKEGTVTGTFADVGRSLQRNKTAKDAIYSQLPTHAQKRLDNLFLIADGVFKLESRMNKSLTARDVIAQQQAQMDAASKLYGKAAKVVGALSGAQSGPMGAAATGTATEGLVNAMTSKSKVAVKADDLLASPGFQKAIKDMAKDDLGVVELRLKNTPEYKAWEKEVSPTEKAIINRDGFFRWMSTMPAADAATSPDTNVPEVPQKPYQQGIDPMGMINQAEQLKRQSIIESANKSVMDKADSIATAYKVPANRNLGIDLGHVASLPPYVGTQLLREANPQTAPINEAIIRLAHGNPENRQAVKMVKNVLQNNGMLLPDSIAGSIQNMVASGIKPEKAVQLATAQKTIKPQEAKKIAELIRGKLSPDVIKDFAPLISSIEALA